MKNKWQILFVTASGTSVTFMDTTVIPIALPTIQQHFPFTETSLVWVVNAYLLSLTAFLLLAGRLIDLIGKRNAFMVGLGVFALGSVVGGLSNTIPWLIIARIFQGLGGAFLVPTTGAILMNHFEEGERAKAFGINTGISATFLIIGPLIGGILTQYLTWRSVFLVNLPLNAFAFMMALKLLKKEEVKRETFHIGGAIPLIIGIAALVVALMQSNAWGWGSAKTITLLAISPLFFSLFVWTSLTTKEPLIDFRLFKHRLFSAATFCIFLVQTLLMVTVLWAIYFQDQLHFTPIKTGLMIFIAVGPVFLIAPLAGYLADRLGPRRPLLCGFVFLTFALFWLLSIGSEQSILLYLPGLLSFGFGIPLIMSPLSPLALSHAPREKIGSAVGITVLSRQLASTTGIAIMTAIFYTTLRMTSSHVKAFSMISLLAACMSVCGFFFVWFVIREPKTKQNPV